MAGVTNQFFGLEVATLNNLLANYINCLTQISVIGQSYTMGERQFSQAHLPEVRQTIQEIQAALRFAQGQRISSARGNFAGRRFWRF